MKNARVKKVLILIAGWGFLLLGVIGLFLPVLQGILFILIGLSILCTQHAWANRWLQKLRSKFPKIATAADHGTAKVYAWFSRNSAT